MHAVQCWAACIADAECNFWVWCASRAGCDEGGAFNGRYPHRGCGLAAMPRGVPVQQWERGPLYSSISSGFVTGARSPKCCSSPLALERGQRITSKYTWLSSGPACD